LQQEGDKVEAVWVNAAYDDYEKTFYWMDSNGVVQLFGNMDWENGTPGTPTKSTGLQVKLQGRRLVYRTADQNTHQKYVCIG